VGAVTPDDIRGEPRCRLGFRSDERCPAGGSSGEELGRLSQRGRWPETRPRRAVDADEPPRRTEEGKRVPDTMTANGAALDANGINCAKGPGLSVA